MNSIKSGSYQFFVHNFSARGATSGFKAELEIEGQVYEYSYPKPLSGGQDVSVVTVNVAMDGTVSIDHKLENSQSSKSIYNLNTNQFAKVNSIMLSPNHWHNTAPKGNKHFMFILDDCQTKDTVRGFYNEFLSNDLNQHRKVFEVLASKMQVQPDTEQLAGLGFSYSITNDLTVKINGRLYKILLTSYTKYI
jgi:hypothetical protein